MKIQREMKSQLLKLESLDSVKLLHNIRFNAARDISELAAAMARGTFDQLDFPDPDQKH